MNNLKRKISLLLAFAMIATMVFPIMVVNAAYVMTITAKRGTTALTNGQTITINSTDTNRTITVSNDVSSTEGLKLGYSWNGAAVVLASEGSKIGNITIPNFAAGTTNTLQIEAIINDYTNNIIGNSNVITLYIKVPATTAVVTTIEAGLKYNGTTLLSGSTSTILAGSSIIMDASSNVGIKQMGYCWDNGSLITFAQGLSSGTITVPTTFVAGSTHTLQIQAIATDGTVSTAKTYTIKIPAEIIEEDELIVEPWMKETTELDGLAVSLRNDSDEDKGNKNIYMLGEEVQYFVDYKNAGKDITSAVKLVLELPLSADVVESDGGTVSGNEVTWNFANGLEEEQAGTKEVVVKYTSLGKSNIESKVIYPVAQIYKSTKLMDSSAVINLIFKDEDVEIDDTHYPYMFGDEEAPTFRPNDIITRAEGALVLTRIFGINTYGVVITNVYPDLDETYEEAQKAIVAATNMGLINGYTDGTYRPNATMTRAEFMKIIAANVELNAEENDIVGLNIKDSESDIKKYKDTTRSYTVNGSTVSEHWASPYVTLLARLNMTALTSSSRDLRLDENITRAEVAQLVNFYLLRAPAKVNSRTTTDFIDVSRSHKLFADIVEATRAAHTYTLTTEGLEIAE